MACGEIAVFYRRVLAVIVLLLSGTVLAAARDLALVSNKANNVNAVTPADLVKICKGQTARLPDGKTLTFVMRAPKTPEMKLVLEKIYAMPGSEVNDLITAANRGRSGHPAIMVVGSDDDLVNTVASMPGAVGIVDVYSINSSVAVVKIAGKLPLEPGYLLHGN
jgi:predicted methyltransferase